MKMNLSDEVIAGLEPKNVKYRVGDEYIPGLCVLVSPSGTKVMAGQYTSWKYRFSKNVTLGTFGEITYKEAREKAIEMLAKLKSCKNKDEANQVTQGYKKKRKTRINQVDAARKRLSAQIRESAIPRPHVDMPFHDGSKLKHDFAWPELWIAFNVFGGYVVPTAKSSVTWIMINNHNLARSLGWSVYIVSTEAISNGGAIELISKAVKSAIKKQEGVLDNES